MKGYHVYSKIQQFRMAGFSQRQVARRLGINRKTVKRYGSKYLKVGYKSRIIFDRCIDTVSGNCYNNFLTQCQKRRGYICQRDRQN